MKFVRPIAAWAAAVVIMAAGGVIVQTLFNLAALSGVGAQIGAGDALFMITSDLGGLAPLYGFFIAIAFLIAFPAAAFAGRLAPAAPRIAVFTAAGFASIAIMLALMEQAFFGVQVIAGARSIAGFWAQTLVGGLAGAAFAMLTRGPERRTDVS